MPKIGARWSRYFLRRPGCPLSTSLQRTLGSAPPDRSGLALIGKYYFYIPGNQSFMGFFFSLV